MTSFKNTKPYIETLFRIGHELEDLGLEDQADKVLDAARKIAGATLFGNFPSKTLLHNLQSLFAEQGVQFVIIGGVAVSVRGYPRETEDIDMLVDKLPDKIATNSTEYMRTFDFYRSRSSTGTVQGFEPRSGGEYAEAILVQTPLDKYALDTATAESVLGTKVPVVAPDALIALKVRACTENPSRQARDRADIVAVWESSKKPNLGTVLPLLNEEEQAKLKSFLPEAFP
jgi:predicted nucleotidyltransferase